MARCFSEMQRDEIRRRLAAGQRNKAIAELALKSREATSRPRRAQPSFRVQFRGE